jgi:methionine synthase I (cobalamin-dependent)
VTSSSEQIKHLILDGVDLLLIETVVDSLNAKAALFAAQSVMVSLKKSIPVVDHGSALGGIRGIIPADNHRNRYQLFNIVTDCVFVISSVS